MRVVESSETGAPKFTASQCLTWQQIASFWTNYARLRKRELEVRDDVADEIDDSDYTTDQNLQSEQNVLENIVEIAVADIQ